MNDDKNNKIGEILGHILVITLIACVSVIAVGLTVKFLSFIF